MNQSIDPDELIDVLKAAEELKTSPETARLIFINSFVFHRGDFVVGSPPRYVWHCVLKAEPVLQLYYSQNNKGHSKPEIAARAVPMFDLADASARRRLVQTHSSSIPERLKALRRRLLSFADGAGDMEIQNLSISIRTELKFLTCSSEQLLVAWSEIRPDYLGKLVGGARDVPPLRVCETVAAIDLALTQRWRRGAKSKHLARLIHKQMEDDYFWLTGLIPSKGGFIDFQRSIYRAAGIPSPSEGMLRGPRDGE